MDLFIDTHLNDVIIILSENGKIICEERLEEEKENSKLIMPTIKKVLGENTPESIIVVNGPGSFTGVRLGVTIAKTFAYTLDIPIRTITSLECIAACTEDCDKIVAFCDKNGYYVGIFDEDLNLIGNYEYLSNSEFSEYREKHNVITDVTIDYNKVIAYALKKETLNPHKVNPIYVKKLDVEKNDKKSRN